MDNGQLEEAFLKFRERLERLAAQTLNPILSGRVSPEDVVQETMVAVSRDDSPFMANPDLPLYFKLRTALLQTIAQIELFTKRDQPEGEREYDKQVYVLPKILDEKVARLHLDALGVELTELSKEQAQYLDLEVSGPYKPEHYRY